MGPRARRVPTEVEPTDLALVAARAADAKQATDIVGLVVGPVLAITEVFVVTTASNSRQVRAVVDEVEKQVKETFGRSPKSVEGLEDRQWVLLDYGDVIVHVFSTEAREYYELDRLWSDVEILDFEGGSENPAAAAL